MFTNTPNRIWSVTLDDRYIVTVDRTGDYTGELAIHLDDKELLREPVGLSYGALFGPDVDDVQTWQRRAIKFVDEGV